MSTTEVDALRALSQALQSAGIVLGLVLAAILTYLTGEVLRRLGSEEGALIPREGLALRSIVPDIEMTNLRTGATFRASDLRGKKILIAFLSGQCRPCRELVPHLNALAEEFKEIAFIAVVDKDAGERHLVDLAPSIRVVEDRSNWPIGNEFEMRFAPLVYVVDPEGRVSIRAVPNTRLQLEDALDGSGHLQRAAWTPAKEPS